MDDLIPKPYQIDENCWIQIFQYLNLRDKWSLASTNDYLMNIFKTQTVLQGLTHIDLSSISNNPLTDHEIHRLLCLANKYVISFTGSMAFKDNSEQHVWLLRDYCPNLRKLKLLFIRDMSKTLKDLPNIEELHARLHFGKLSIENRRALEHLRNLKRLTLEASNYFGDELCRLSRLEYLEIGSHGFDAAALTECCITMGDLRHLNMGHKIEGLSTDHFITIAEECAQLERLAFGIRNLDTNVEYEFVCRLPKLQHLFVWINGAVRTEFLVGLINKVAKPKPIESLILVGSRLPIEQVDLVCQITSLKELDISCDAAAVQDLLNLRNVKYLHITIPEITNDQLKELILNLPQLILLNVRSCRLITEQFVASILELLPHIENRMRKKIKIHLKGSDINWSQIDHKLLQRKKAVVEIINETLEEPILIRQELTMNQSN